MATNPYFSQGRRSERRLYEDLIIESLKMYGQDVYYLPRELVKRDDIFSDDPVSRFDNSYKIEMYIQNVEGFDNASDLFTKFGVEIRPECTFIVSRRRWNTAIAAMENSTTKPFYRPREGDLIYLSLSKSLFEITKVDNEQPFFQLQNFPIFSMRCHLFEYNDEDFDTDVQEIDEIENVNSQQTVLTFDKSSITGGNGTFDFNELVRQVNTSFTIEGEVANIDNADSDQYKVYIKHKGTTNGTFGTFTTNSPVLGLSSSATGTPFSVGEPELEASVQNEYFDSDATNILDFSESNPFGDPL